MVNLGKLDGKVAIITGAASGIGKATSRLFVEEGAKVVMADISDEIGKKIADDLGVNAEYVHTDVSNESEIINVINFTVEKFGGRLDIVFSNAGNPGPGGLIEDIETIDFDITVSIHLRAAYLFMKHSIPIMKKQRSGSLICTSSVSAYRSGMGTVPYSCSKAAILELTRIAAVELGPFGIRANAIVPGGIVTGIFSAAYGLSQNGVDRYGDYLRKSLAKNQAIRRAGEPEDIARTALFLVSDDSGFITGQPIIVDGGLLAGRSIPPDPEESLNNYYEMVNSMNSEDKQIIVNSLQEGAKRSQNQLQYLTPEERDRQIKQMKEIAERRAKRITL